MPDKTLLRLVGEDKNSNWIKDSQASQKSTWYDWYREPSKAGKSSKRSKMVRLW